MKILAPFSGLLVPLNEVPDEAFSQKLVGDGISIDPVESTLHSPVDGVIDFIHPSQHALTIKAQSGAQILVHIGVDTVQLKGEGFKAQIKSGDLVKAGQPLVKFDADWVAVNSKSLITQILVANPEEFELLLPSHARGQSVKSGDVLFTLKGKKTGQQANVPAVGGEKLIRRFVCGFPTGLHARPAAAIVQAAKKYNSEIQFIKGAQQANAKSLVSLLALSVGPGDEYTLSVYGHDAATAIDELTLLIDVQISNEVHSPAPVAPKTEKIEKVTGDVFNGVSASPGLVLGRLFQADRKAIVITENLYSNDFSHENEKLKSALFEAEVDLRALISQLKQVKNEEQAAIFKAHLEVLNDPEIVAGTQEKIQQGLSAQYAWQESVNGFKNTLSALQNEVMATRAHDLHDVGQRVLRHLLGIKEVKHTHEIPFSESAILVARNLTPSDMVLIDPNKVRGICSVEGGASSHVAIIARSMGLAYIVAVDDGLLRVPTGTEALLNAKAGTLNLKVTDAERRQAEAEISHQKEQDVLNFKAAAQPALTADGHRIEVFANVGKLKDAQDAIEHGAEGIGLLRSEFLFLHRNSAPTEAEQLEKYQEIVSALKAKPVIIRTLDVGGDKPLSYLPLPPEENPFLGVRGLRMSLRSPELFRQQLRALLKVKPLTAVQIMFPMVTTVSELIDAKAILNEEAKKLGVEKVSVGIMIEVPSAALMAEQLAPHVDFFSIGSNDLTQYTLAIDRGHRELANMADGLHPSVLQLIKITCDAAIRHKKVVGVCGGIAGDAHAVPLLIGLGVHELSVSVPVIPTVKAQIRKLNKKDCETLAARALAMGEAQDVRKLVEKYI